MKKSWLGYTVAFSLLLSGCTFGESTDTQLSNVLSVVYEKEEGYRDAQEELSELETQEQETFNEVMELTQKDKEKVAALASELESSVSKRKTLLEQETESMESAEASLSSFEELLNETKDEEIKSLLAELEEALNNRFDAHDLVTEEYLKLAELQQTLYGLLPKEETKQIDLQEQVDLVNSQNEKVQSAIQAFNDSTQEVNRLKETVYSTLAAEN